MFVFYFGLGAAYHRQGQLKKTTQVFSVQDMCLRSPNELQRGKKVQISQVHAYYMSTVL